MSVKKILFPFLNKTRHQFLREKWWFRLIAVIYTSAFVITPFVLWNSYMDGTTGWCYSSLPLYDNFSEYKEQLNECKQLSREERLPGALLSVFTTLIIH